MSLNKCCFIGRLGADPEVRSFSNGGRVVNLRLAVSERYKDREGNRQEKTTWVPVAIFSDKLGEIAEKYLRKGSEVYIEGKMEVREYEKDGQKRYATEIVLRQFGGEIVLLGGRSSGGDSAEPRQEASAPRGGGEQRRAPPSSLDDDIPF